MAVVTDLPVFMFRMNWNDALTETLAFLTSVLPSPTGAEQRISTRQTPRRTYEADFLLTGPERTFWDLFINRLGGQELYIPMPWEFVVIRTRLVQGAATRIDFDPSFTEWPYLSGYAILQGDSALESEIVEFTPDANGIVLNAPVAQTWPVGSKLIPLRRGVIDDIGTVSQPTAGVAKVTTRFRFKTPNKWTPAADMSPVYAGLPVFTNEPNWVEDLSVRFDRSVNVLDTGIGKTYDVDTLNRVFLGQAHRWFLRGREAMAEFRDLLYRNMGRQGGFWLPTFKADLTLAANAAASATTITVESVGMTYTGGPTKGREYIAIRHDGGTIYRKITSASAGTLGGTEKLGLDQAVGLALSPGQVRKISFMDVARFDSDNFDLIHHAGPDGLHECSALFRTYANTRTAPLPVDAPIPTTNMTPGRCGIWTSRAIVFVLDKSRSMDETVAPGMTRLQSMKISMAQIFDNLKPYAAAYDMDVAVVGFSLNTTTMTRRSVTASDLEALKTFANGIVTDGGGTYFGSGMAAAKTILDGTAASKPDHYIFFVTDGEPTTAATVTQAVDSLNSMVPTPLSRGINIDLANTTETQKIDNTGTPVPVAIGADTSTLVNAVMETF